MTWEKHLKMVPLIRQILLRYLCSLTHACSVAYLMVTEQECTMCMGAISSARNSCNGTWLGDALLHTVGRKKSCDSHTNSQLNFQRERTDILNRKKEATPAHR